MAVFDIRECGTSMWCGSHQPSFSVEAPLSITPFHLSANVTLSPQMLLIFIWSALSGFWQKGREGFHRPAKTTLVVEKQWHTLHIFRHSENPRLPLSTIIRLSFCLSDLSSPANRHWQRWLASLKMTWPTWSPLLPKGAGKKKCFNCYRNLDSSDEICLRNVWVIVWGEGSQAHSTA